MKTKYRIIHKKSGYHPQFKYWWSFWLYYLNGEGTAERFQTLQECERFLENETVDTKVIAWEPKCKS